MDGRLLPKKEPHHQICTEAIMLPQVSRRGAIQALAAATAIPALVPQQAEARVTPGGWVTGSFSGARALVETLLSEGTRAVFGIPGAQENELWDEMKQRGLNYTLVTHEFSAATMADGYARATGQPGVIAIVPGPGITNCMTGLGEARLDSIPIVCIVGDVARGEKYRAFQVHELDNTAMLKTVCKQVFSVDSVGDIPLMVRQAFVAAQSDEPGPVAVVVPYNLFLERHLFRSAPIGGPVRPLDLPGTEEAIELLSKENLRIGIYAGLGCMDHSAQLVRLAEVLQAPVATSVSGKGAFPADHPLSVGWGYGPQGSIVAERAFGAVDVVLAIGVRFSEVSTGFYSFPKKRLIHVDQCRENLGAVYSPEVLVHADAGRFLGACLAQSDRISRQPNPGLADRILSYRESETRVFQTNYARRGNDPMALILAIRENMSSEDLFYVDVTASEHLAAEAWQATQPRTYFNPTDNQGMGWSLPAAMGGQRAFPGRKVATLTGDGCLLMSAMELSTAARENLPVKFFILDDGAYHYMQMLQGAAYKRTTATILAPINYESLAKGLGVGYVKIESGETLAEGVKSAFAKPGPVLIQVSTDYGTRPFRWIDAARNRFISELSREQKIRFAARLGSRSVVMRQGSD